MITIDTVVVCDIPVAREALGFPKQWDRGNAVLLLAQEMRPETRARYQIAECVREGVCIASCSEEVYAILEQLQLRYCPWPDRDFTLVVLDHSRVGVLADRMVVSRLTTADAAEKCDHSNEREA